MLHGEKGFHTAAFTCGLPLPLTDAGKRWGHGQERAQIGMIMVPFAVSVTIDASYSLD
jgi:hypothetical protein